MAAAEALKAAAAVGAAHLRVRPVESRAAVGKAVEKDLVVAHMVEERAVDAIVPNFHTWNNKCPEVMARFRALRRDFEQRDLTDDSSCNGKSTGTARLKKALVPAVPYFDPSSDVAKAAQRQSKHSINPVNADAGPGNGSGKSTGAGTGAQDGGQSSGVAWKA